MSEKDKDNLKLTKAKSNLSPKVLETAKSLRRDVDYGYQKGEGAWYFKANLEKRFCLAYVRLGDPVEAWLTVWPGDTWGQAQVKSKKLLKEPRIVAYLKHIQEEAERRAVLDTQELIADDLNVVKSNVQDLFDPGWKLKDNADLPEHVARTLKNVKIEEVYDKDGVLVKRRVYVQKEPKDDAKDRLYRVSGMLDSGGHSGQRMTVVVMPQAIRKNFD